MALLFCLNHVETLIYLSLETVALGRWSRLSRRKTRLSDLPNRKATLFSTLLPAFPPEKSLMSHQKKTRKAMKMAVSTGP